MELKKLDDLGWFDLLVRSDDVSSGKPNPACLLQVRSMTGISASRALILKDLNVAIEVAQGGVCFDVSGDATPIYLPDFYASSKIV
jgi:beta-phosphoglucomutase-like phosphatase (HAD superfamily)